MKYFSIIWVLLAVAMCGCDSEKEQKENYFREKMLPLAQEFIRRNDLSLPQNLKTNHVARWKFDLYDDGRTGGQGSIRVEPKHFFSFFIHNNRAEVRSYIDGNANTYYDLTSAPPEKVEAVKALLLKNKLNNETALELAKKFFKRQGHREENFHPVQSYQLGWTGPVNSADGEWEWHPKDGPARGGLLPYYRATWYRKDANLNEQGTLHPLVEIEVSGITLSLIRYSKISMPVGSDF